MKTRRLLRFVTSYSTSEMLKARVVLDYAAFGMMIRACTGGRNFEDATTLPATTKATNSKPVQDVERGRFLSENWEKITRNYAQHACGRRALLTYQKLCGTR